MERIFNKINELLKKKELVVVTIDGCAASGKTTLANMLKDKYKCEVIRLDDFFLPLEKRTTERLNTPGGNIDYERFKESVIDKLGSSFSYGVFNCSIMKIDKEIYINKSKLIIIEGSYSMHPYFGKYYDLSIFLDIEKEDQINRIRKRNGEKLLEMFVNKWIKYEQMYFSYYSIKEIADIKLSYLDL